MKFLKSISAKFTARGRALAKVAKGGACAKKREPDNAIKYYTDVVDTSESPRDVLAMALFNRALVFTTIGKECRATEDLKTILSMPETIAKIKKSANDKLVRMQRKLEREESPKSDD